MNVIAFRDLQPGQRFSCPGRTLTETDHNLFMMLVGDWHPIHSNEIYARQTSMGRRVMHGTLGVALAMGMQERTLHFVEPIVGALGLDGWRFSAPLFIGETVHVEVEILGARVTSRGDRGIVERKISLLNHDCSLIQQGRADVMLQLSQPEKDG